MGRVEGCAGGHAPQRWPRSWAASLDRSVEIAGDMGVRGKKAGETLELSQLGHTSLQGGATALLHGSLAMK